MIVERLSRRSLRAAGGLRRPSESRALLASKPSIYLDDASSFEPRPLDLPDLFLHVQGRTGDPKTMVRTTGIIARGTSASRHRRWILRAERTSLDRSYADVMAVYDSDSEPLSKRSSKAIKKRRKSLKRLSLNTQNNRRDARAKKRRGIH